MAYTFRKAIFNLCKQINESPNENVLETRKLMRHVMVSNAANDDSNALPRYAHGDLGYLAMRQGVQFLGYLLIDDATKKINEIFHYQTVRFSSEERRVFEKAHRTIECLISLCLEELNDKYPNLTRYLNPYCKYTISSKVKDVETILSITDLHRCAKAFKKGKVYKRIIENDVLSILEKIDNDHLSQSFETQDNQFSKAIKHIPSETEQALFALHAKGDSINEAQVLWAYTVFCFALKSSLSIAAQMVFQAIIGEDMMVFSNNNIITLPEHTSDIVYDRYALLVQDAAFGLYNGGLGGIALLTCDVSDTYNIKEFGMITSLSVNIDLEFGSTSKIVLITFDEELNWIHRLTDSILSTKIGELSVAIEDSTNEIV